MGKFVCHDTRIRRKIRRWVVREIVLASHDQGSPLRFFILVVCQKDIRRKTDLGAVIVNSALAITKKFTRYRARIAGCHTPGPAHGRNEILRRNKVPVITCLRSDSRGRIN